MKGNRNNSLTIVEDPVFGIFLRRENRFVCLVDLDGYRIKTYLPNTGRLEELLVEGGRVVLEKRRESGKTQYDLLLIETESYPSRKPIWVNLDSRIPPKLMSWAIDSGYLPDFDSVREIRFEPGFQSGRFDIHAVADAGDIYIETKSVNLLDRTGVARFPDARTIRGTKHIRELIHTKRAGNDACIAFVVTRHDAVGFSPFTERDGDFTDALLKAQKSGVEIRALRFKSGCEFEFTGEIPSVIPGEPFPGFWPPSADIGM